MATHTLRVVTADGTTERPVNSTERLLLKTATDLESFKVGELSRVSVGADYGSTSTLTLVYANGQATIRQVPRAGRLELGDERYPFAELATFLLAVVPTPKTEQPSPSCTWRVTHMDDSEQVVTLESARVLGAITGTWEDGWSSREWDAMLSDVKSLERVET